MKRARLCSLGVSDDKINLDLSAEERDLLVRGLIEWGGGPTRPTDALAPAMGFKNLTELRSGVRALYDALERHEALTAGDWARALIATEFAFASDYYGSGVEWTIATGHADEDTIRLLRAVQRKLVRMRLPDGP